MLGIVWKRWNWLDIFLIPLSVTLMQVVCIAPIFSALLHEPTTGITETGFVFWLCLGIMLAGAAVAQLATQNRMAPFIVVFGAIIAILVAWMLVIPPGAQALDLWFADVVFDLTHASVDRLPVPLVTLIFAVFLWWRGLRAQSMQHEGVLGLFAIGMAIQLGILLISFKSMSRLSGTLMLQMLLFLAASMAAFSFAQISRTMREQERRTGTTLRIDRYWVGTISGVIGVLILVGLFVSQFISPESFRIFKPLWDTIVQIFLLIVYVFAYLFFGLLEPLLDRMPEERRDMTMPFESAVSPGEMMEQLERNPIEVPPIWFQIFQTAVILMGILLVVWLLARALRKREATVESDGIVEERESILSTDLLKAQFQNLLGGLRRHQPPPFLGLNDLQDTRRTVRQVYQTVLAQADALESPRRWGQTPDLYEETLIALHPEGQGAWDTITRVYDIARYGDEPPTREEAQAVLDAYALLAPALKKKMGESEEG
ncbi:MAG: DUF4129 domain-containing protein [Anaerolineae bacterium]|nr:DUF4129 domain-containing protein [Anaerolineae bacterium]